MSQHDTLTLEPTRAAFERYFLESRKSKGANRKPTFERFEDGTYKDDHTQRHWWTWQNALSATQPAQAAQGEPVQGVPDGWEIREDDTWIYFKRPDGFCQAVTPNDPHTSHAQTLHMLMRAMLTSAPTPPAQPAVAQGAGEVVAWVDVHDRTNLYYRKPPQVDVRPLTYADTQPAAGADVRDELQKLPQIASTAMHQDARDMRNILEDIANRLCQLTANDRAAIAASGRKS